MILYLDTSAFVKLVVDEPGSELALRLWDAADVRLTSVLTYAEARAAFAAAVRGRRVAPREVPRLRSLADDRWAELTRVDVTDPIAHAAGELADTLPVRGADSVHLATAIDAGMGDVLVATWDRALASAARRTGCTVAP